MKLYLFALFLLFHQSLAIYVLFGESQVGKSAFINFLSGNVVAKEGFLKSCTNTTSIYFPKSVQYPVLDTPGIFDTRGANDEDIVELIKAEVLRINQVVHGFLILIDGEAIKLRIRPLHEFIATTFGENRGVEKIHNEKIYVIRQTVQE